MPQEPNLTNDVDHYTYFNDTITSKNPYSSSDDEDQEWKTIIFHDDQIDLTYSIDEKPSNITIFVDPNPIHVGNKGPGNGISKTSNSTTDKAPIKCINKNKFLGLSVLTGLGVFGYTQRSAIGQCVTQKAAATGNYLMTHTALPTLMKLSTAKVLGGLGIGLLGWHVALAAGIVALAVGVLIYKHHNNLCHKKSTSQNNMYNP